MKVEAFVDGFDVSEMVIYDRNLTKDEMREVVEYLAWKWEPERSQVTVWDALRDVPGSPRFQWSRTLP